MDDIMNTSYPWFHQKNSAHMWQMRNSTCSVGNSVLMYSTALKSALSKASWLGKTYKTQRKVNAGGPPSSQLLHYSMVTHDEKNDFLLLSDQDRVHF